MDPFQSYLVALVESGRISRSQAQALTAEAQARGRSLAQLLIEQGLLAPDQAAQLVQRGEGTGLPGRATGAPRSERLTPRGPLEPEVRAALADPTRRLGRYALVEELGRGSFGVVYRAYDPELQREVAIKQLVPQEGESAEEFEHQLSRFQVEGQAGARLNHPNIVRVLEVGQERGRPYLVMDYVRGEDLDALLGRGTLSPREIVERIRDVALALGHAHAAGIVHRDVKPGNVLVDSAGRAHLSDFGLARDAERAAGLSKTGQVLGTPLFLSPEQAAGRPQDTCPQSDVFALGGVLYFALTGEPPFPAETLMGLIAAITTHEPRPPSELEPQLNRDLETLILKCLRKDPADRYANGDEVAAELERFLAGQAIQATPASLRGRGIQFAARHKALLGVLCASSLALAIGGGVSLWRIRAERDEALTRRLEAEEQGRAAELARGRAERAEARAREEGARARLAEAEARLAARGAAAQNETRGRQLARSLVEKGQRLSRTGFYNDAAAVFAESLLLREDADARGGLADALENAHQALVSSPAVVVTGLLPVGEGGFLVANNVGVLTLCLPERDPESYPLTAGGIYALARSSSGWLAVGSGAGKVSLFAPGEVSEPREVLPLHEALVTDIAWAPEGERFLSVGWDGSARIWARGQATAARLETPRETHLTCASWGAGGVALGDDLGHVYVWRDPSAADPSAVLAAHAGWVSDLAWTGAGGEELITVGVDGALRRFVPAEGGYALAKEQALGSPALRLALTGGRVAVGLAEGTVQVRDALDLRPLREFSREPRPIRCLSAAGDRVWVGSLSGLVAWFEVEGEGTQQFWTSRDLEHILPGPGSENFIAVDTLGSLAWKQPSGAIARWRSQGAPTALARSEDGRLAANGDRVGSVALLRLGETRPRSVRAHTEPIVSLELSDRGERMLSAAGRNLTIWDPDELKPLFEKNFAGDLLEADLGPRGALWAARLAGGQAFVSGLRGEVHELRGVSAGPRLAPQGPKRVLSAWFAQGEEVYCLGPSGAPRLALRAEALVVELRVSASGRYLSLACREGTVSLYDLARNVKLLSQRGKVGGNFAPELDERGGTWCFTRPDGSAGMWSMHPRRAGQDLRCERALTAILPVAASAFVTGDQGGGLTHWRYEGSEPQRRAQQVHGGAVRALALDAARGRLASVASDGTFAELEVSGLELRRRLALPLQGAAPRSVCYFAPWDAWVVSSDEAPDLLRIPAGAGEPIRVPLAGERRGVSEVLPEAERLVCAELPLRVSWRALQDLSPSASAPLREGRVATSLVAGGAAGEALATLVLVAGRPGATPSKSWTPSAESGSLHVSSISGELWSFGVDHAPRRLAIHPGIATGLARDPSGRFLAWGGASLYLYDLRAGRLHARLRDELSPSNLGAAFLAEGRLLVGMTDRSNQLRVTDLEALALLDTPAEAVERVKRLTQLSVAGLDPIFAANAYELALARALAGR